MFCLCRKTYCCYDRKRKKYKFSSKGLIKRILEDCGEGPMSKYCKVLEEAVNQQRISNNETQRCNVQTDEKGLSYF